MKGYLTGLLIAAAATVATTTSEALTTNKWNLSTSGKWETAVNWSTGNGPSLNDGLDLVSPISSLGIVVTMDATTANNFFGTLTVSNLTVSGIGGIMSRSATLMLSSMDSIAQFTVIKTVTIGAFGNLFATNSILNAGSADFFLNGGAQFYNSTLESKNSFIGDSGGGSLIISNSAYSVTSLYVGLGSGGNGTLLFDGGTVGVVSNAIIGYEAGSIGTVWMIGGLWNAPTTGISIGDGGSGRMIISNGTVQTGGIGLGGSSGTLTLAGGTVTLSDGLSVSFDPVSTDAVWMTGGQLNTTNAGILSTSYIAYSGTGQMTLSNGTWNASQIMVGSQGSLNIVGGAIACKQLSLNGNTNGLAFAQMTSGTLSGPVTVGSNATMIVSGGNWTGSAVIEGQGTLTLGGGTITISGFSVNSGANPSATGTVWLTGGQLTSTGPIGYVGQASYGRMILSNGTWNAGEVHVGEGGDPDSLPNLESDLVVAGGAHTFSGPLKLGITEGVAGKLWMTGGQLSVLNAPTYLGSNGIGQVVVSNGLFQAANVLMVLGIDAVGTLTVDGGTTMCNNLIIGGTDNSPFSGSGNAATWVAGGLLNVAGRTVISSNGTGQMTISNGTWHTTSAAVAPSVFSTAAGTLTIAGGASHVYSNLTIGYVGCTPPASLIISGGALYVTNAAHNALLEVLGGTLTMSGGSLVADKLIVTNPCAHILVTGGSVSYGTVALDPNGDADGDGLPNGWEMAHGLNPFSSLGNDGASGDPDGDGYTNLQEYEAGSDPQNPLSTPANPVAPPFQITSIVKSNNNILLKWNTASHLTNQMQVTTGEPEGRIRPTASPISAHMIIGGTAVTTTNYTDLGGATNKPARYYRVRLVP